MRTIFKEAKENKECGRGYHAMRTKMLGGSKEWCGAYLSLRYGIRWSDKWQIFPIWNMSNNCNRSLLFGIWKLYVEIVYHRKNSFNQKRSLPFQNKLFRFYRLFF